MIRCITLVVNFMLMRLVESLNAILTTIQSRRQHPHLPIEIIADVMSDQIKPTDSSEFHERFSDPKASVILVSEDGLKFRVYDYMLKAAS